MRLWIFAGMALAGASVAHADTVADFYSGKTVTIVVGMPPPDQHDNDGRLLARFMSKYMPGNPNFIVQSMPGGGSLKAAQYLYSVAPRDGATFGIVQRGMMMMPLLGYPEANFDPTKFTWIGTRAGETSIVVVWNTSPTKSIEDARSRETIVASSGGGADSNTMPFIYNATLGTKFKVVVGYAGGGDMNLAMERGEVEGRTGWSVGAMRGTHEDWFQNGAVRIILQHAMRKSAALPGVPLAQDLASNESDRRLLELFAMRQEIGFPVFGPPGVPPERTRALREAYNKAMKDPDYATEVKKMSVELDPLTGEEMQALIDRIYASPREVVARARDILIQSGAMPR